MASIQKPTFSTYLLNNYLGLEQFLDGREAIAEIKDLSQNEKFIKRPSKPEPYFNRWSIFWIHLTSPFTAITSLFFYTVSYLLNKIYIESYSRYFSVLSNQMKRDQIQLNDQLEFNEPIMVPTLNCHKLDSWDIYKLPSLTIDFKKNEEDQIFSATLQASELIKGRKKAFKLFFRELSDQYDEKTFFQKLFSKKPSKIEIEKTTWIFKSKFEKKEADAFQYLRDTFPKFNLDLPLDKLYKELKTTEMRVQNNSHLQFYSDRGLCRGASMWFISLYLRTQSLFTDPVKHLIAVAEQFKVGMPRQAALLQALNNSDHLLKLGRTNCKGNKISLFELDQDKASAQKKINDLAPGIYRVGVYHHSFVYIKLSNTEGYVWNPFFGLIPKTPEEMFNMIEKYHYRKGDPDSHIYFHRYERIEDLSLWGG